MGVSRSMFHIQENRMGLLLPWGQDIQLLLEQLAYLIQLLPNPQQVPYHTTTENMAQILFQF